MRFTSILAGLLTLIVAVAVLAWTIQLTATPPGAETTETAENQQRLKRLRARRRRPSRNRTPRTHGQSIHV